MLNAAPVTADVAENAEPVKVPLASLTVVVELAWAMVNASGLLALLAWLASPVKVAVTV